MTEHIIYTARLTPSNLHVIFLHQRHLPTTQYCHLAIWAQNHRKRMRLPTGTRVTIINGTFLMIKTQRKTRVHKIQVHTATNKDRKKYDLESKLAEKWDTMVGHQNTTRSRKLFRICINRVEMIQGLIKYPPIT